MKYPCYARPGAKLRPSPSLIALGIILDVTIEEIPMPTIDIPSDMFERIRHRAAVLGTTVEALVVPALENVARDPESDELEQMPNGEQSTVAWKARFDELLNQVRNRAERYHYPTGFKVDVSRESMYEDRKYDNR